ncbi:MAG: PilZ domain-containing protein [Bacteriovorax sp.]|nr:PilZ domain-containing protein [Bacteriovorax sp.]
MNKKPWAIIFLSALFFILPIFNIMGTCYILQSEYTLPDYLYDLFLNHKNYGSLAGMILPSLVAGISLFSVKKWSYPVFLISIYSIAFQMIYTFSPHLKFPQLIYTILLPVLVNIFYVSYILLPKIRAPYDNKRLRWWEAKPRYFFSTEVNIRSNGNKTLGKLVNISEGGINAAVDGTIDQSADVDLTFEVLGKEIELKAKTVYQNPNGSTYGFQFKNLTKEQKKILKKLLRDLARLNMKLKR